MARPDIQFFSRIDRFNRLNNWSLQKTRTYTALAHNLVHFCMKRENPKNFSISATASKIFTCYIFRKAMKAHVTRYCLEIRKTLKLGLQRIYTPLFQLIFRKYRTPQLRVS